MKMPTFTECQMAYLAAGGQATYRVHYGAAARAELLKEFDTMAGTKLPRRLFKVKGKGWVR
jgi:hypothetical protein